MNSLKSNECCIQCSESENASGNRVSHPGIRHLKPTVMWPERAPSALEFPRFLFLAESVDAKDARPPRPPADDEEEDAEDDEAAAEDDEMLKDDEGCTGRERRGW